MLLEQASAGTSSAWEREETEYLRILEKLQTELKKIRSENTSIKQKTQSLISYYRQKAPHIIPPNLEHDPQDPDSPSPIEITTAQSETADIVQRVPTVSIDDPTEDSTDSPDQPPAMATVVGPSTTLGGPIIQEMNTTPTNDKEEMAVPATKPVYTVKNIPNPEPEDLSEIIKELKEIMQNPTVDDDVIKVALMEFNWDKNIAIDSLFDSENLSRYKKEVERLKQTTDGNP